MACLIYDERWFLWRGSRVARAVRELRYPPVCEEIGVEFVFSRSTTEKSNLKSILISLTWLLRHTIASEGIIHPPSVGMASGSEKKNAILQTCFYIADFPRLRKLTVPGADS